MASKKSNKSLRDRSLVEAIKDRDDVHKKLSAVLEYAAWSKQACILERKLGFNSLDQGTFEVMMTRLIERGG